ncbi:hypothetical protein C5167_045959 [Papaver somniferum]|uniref:RING-type E3 ubiquitin transferase n=2 Tax=Papaver somniferum TaxID=3469 RepID=A0A4Y7LCG8_PAPSO|nr:hypothetical protein C5167_045959 [Papaver somniferum]
MSGEGNSDAQLFQVLSHLLQQVESLTNQEEVELRTKIEALGLEVTKVPKKPAGTMDELEIAKELDKLSAKLDDVDEMITSAIAEDPQVQTLLSSTADLWMPVITATSEERQIESVGESKMSSPSLEDLLSEEGFKSRKSKMKSRLSFGSKAVSMPLYLDNDNNQLGSSASSNKKNNKIKTERTRSDMSRYRPRSDYTSNQESRTAKPLDYLVVKSERTKEMKGKDKEIVEIFDEMDSYNEIQRLENEVVNERRRSDVRESDRIKDKLSHKLPRENGKGKERERYSNGFGERQKYKDNNKSNKILNADMASSDSYEKNMNAHESLRIYSKSSRASQNGKTLEKVWSGKHSDSAQPVSEPALDEAAIQAVVSILNGHIKHFLKDKNFRETLRQNCFTCLHSIKLEEEPNADNKAISSLEQAIATVERVVKEYANVNELKKASLQLSFITSLKSTELEDGYTSRFPNSELSACAHIYLSVIYKIQEKDRISAKHLLQVFCDSPSQARKALLPGLWEYLFLPHLSHLNVWYDKEERSLADTSSAEKKKKQLRKVYNETLDSGTYQLATYYKDWLTGRIKTPLFPCIQIPSISVRGVSGGGSHGSSSQLGSPVSSVSSQPMVSKRLYGSVFGFSNKMEGEFEAEDREEQESFKSCLTVVEVVADKDGTETLYSPEHEKYSNQLVEELPAKFTDVDTTSQAEDEGLLPAIAKLQRSHRTSAPREKDPEDEVSITSTRQRLPHKKVSELILKKLAASVFQQQQTESFNDSTTYKDMPMNDSHEYIGNTNSCLEGQYVNDEYFGEESFFSSIPEDFICPFTGELFEEPVTLETGQTFDRMAIKEWFDQGHKTCPVTGRTLKCHTLPTTSFVLKRAIDHWKSEHRRNLLASACQIEGNQSAHEIRSTDERAILVLEQLLFCSTAEDRCASVKHLISLGGLQYLTQRFELGKLDEKTHIAALLSCCIESDGGCRNYLAKSLNKACLSELLYNKQVRSKTNGMLLLTELICLNRRTEITAFLVSLKKEGTMNIMHVLLVYLQCCLPDQKPLAAVLLLHLDLMVTPQKHSIYREEAVDSIAVALKSSLTNEKIRKNCCKALLILGGKFPLSGELLTESWCLRQAGFYDQDSKTNSLGNVEDCLSIDKTIPLEEDELKTTEDWWKNLASLLLGNGNKSFLEIISKCLGSKNLYLVRTCLITVTWMSHALGLLPDIDFHLAAFSALLPQLKQILLNDGSIEHKVLASTSLLNFTKITECRMLLMTIGEEILVSLQSLAGVTWTSKQLFQIISGES